MEESSRSTRSKRVPYSPVSTPASPTSPASSSVTTQSHSPIKARRNVKLTNQDRTEICQYRLDHPATKQDTIAQLFGVERSTVSKILKLKEKYLAVEEISSVLLPDSTSPPFPLAPPAEPIPRSKGRFPSLEAAVLTWAREQFTAADPTFYLSDSVLHAKAVELSTQFSECEKFKASAGWMEKFKARAGIVDGIFTRLEDEMERDSVSSTPRSQQPREIQMMIDSEDDGMETSSISTRSKKKDVKKKPVERAKRPGHSRRNSEIAPTTAVIESNLPRVGFSPTKAQYIDTNAGYSPQSLLLLQQERNSQRVQNVPSVDNPSYYPFTFSQSSVQTYQVPGPLDYPLQSPFQPNSSTTSNSSIQSQANSGANSPRNYLANHSNGSNQHVRSNSTTSSINSNFSTLTSFSTSQNSQNSTASSSHNNGTSLASSTSSYSLVSNSGNGSLGSLPTTPSLSSNLATGTGYFGHGSDGRQSQLQFAFAPSSNSNTEHHSGLKRDGSWLGNVEGGVSAIERGFISPYAITESKKKGGVPRRATISGGSSSFTGFNSPTPLTLHQQQPIQYHPQHQMKLEELDPIVFPHHRSEPVPSLEPEFPPVAEEEEHVEPDVEFESCLQSLEQAMRYLSTKGNGFVTPSDLIVLSDLKGKMINHHISPRTSSPNFRHDRQNSSHSMTQSQSMDNTGGRNLIPRTQRMERTQSHIIPGGRSSRRLSGINPNPIAIHNGFMNLY